LLEISASALVEARGVLWKTARPRPPECRM